MDLDSLLQSLYVLVDDWRQERHPDILRKSGRPPLLTDSEVLTLAILSQWPRWRSERDFWRFADAQRLSEDYLPGWRRRWLPTPMGRS